MQNDKRIAKLKKLSEPEQDVMGWNPTILTNGNTLKEGEDYILIKDGIEELFSTPMLDKSLKQSEPSNEIVNKKRFGRQRYPKKPLDGVSSPDNRKIKAVKKEQDGITFDSTLELYMYNLLKQNDIRFEMKVSFVIQESFTYLHESIREMIVTPDFILTDYPYIIDTKGFANERVPMQYKMLKHKLHLESNEKRIFLPSNQAKCRHLVQCIKQGYFTVEEPITEHAGTRRKNKLKKHGWRWLFEEWHRDNETSYSANYLMSLQSYDFEELLLKHR